MQFASDDGELPGETDVRRWVQGVFSHLDQTFERGHEISVRIVDSDEGRALNKQYRGRDSATNVLSFPAGEDIAVPDGEPLPLGDLVLCAPVIAREAAEQGKKRTDHWAHMLLHGTLHLLGYDHEADANAAEMEALEVAILDTWGVANPYLVHDPGA